MYTHTHTHTMEYYSAIEKDEILLFAATQMDLESIMLSDIRQRQTNAVCMYVCMYDIIYMWNLKNAANQ